MQQGKHVRCVRTAWVRSVVFTLLALGAGSVAAESQDAWERRASAWWEGQVERVGDPERLEGATLEALVDASFLHARVGNVDVRFPFALIEDPTWRQRAVGALAALCEVQVRWADWRAGGEAADPAARDLAELGEALRKLKPSKLRRVKAVPGSDLLAALPLDEELLAAVAVRSAAAPRTDGGPAGSAGEPVADDELARRPVRLVVLHERGAFLDYVAAVALAHPFLRDVFWVSDVEQWLAIHHDRTRAIALSFYDAGNVRGPGIPMDERNPKALDEHVAQVAARGLIEESLGAGVEAMLAGGLATELVIDVFGEADTYTDGDTGARATRARSVFIPGGNPNGGILPPVPADSRWRAERGRDHFVGALRRAQKDGAKEAGRKAGKLPNFLLQSRSGRQEYLVRAPFLGPGGSESEPPGAFREDHLGFLRGYRAAFLHWLRTEAGGRRHSPERFRELLSALADPALEDDTQTLLEQVYGLPLSAADLEDEDSLEGEFLRWLSKRR